MNGAGAGSAHRGEPDPRLLPAADRPRAGRHRASTQVDRRSSTIAIIVLVASVGALGFLFAQALDEPIPACTTTSTSVCTGVPVDHTERGAEKDSLPPCPTEDSTGCYWDASQGNGHGRSFVVTEDGTVYYLEPR